jgi:hypothetical protein
MLVNFRLLPANCNYFSECLEKGFLSLIYDSELIYGFRLGLQFCPCFMFLGLVYGLKSGFVVLGLVYGLEFGLWS